MGNARTKILAIADVEQSWLTTGFDPERLRGVNMILSCGDLPARYLEHVVTMANLPLLYVPGNHDTAYRSHAPGGCDGIDARIREVAGVRIMGFGGSMRYNERVYGFTEQEMRRRVMRLAFQAKLTGGVDIVVTHAPPYGYSDMDDYAHTGFDVFNTAIEILRPAYLVHGHIHMEYGRIDRVIEHPAGTRIVNACGSYMFEL